MHIVIDARIRRASTGKPVDRLLEYLQETDSKNKYTVLLSPKDDWKPKSQRFNTAVCRFRIFSFNPLQQILYAWQLYRLKPDLVHFTMTAQQPIFYFGKQTTFTHDLTMLKYVRAGRLPLWLHKLRMIGYRFLLWQSHRKATAILVPTEYVKTVVNKHHLFTGRKVFVTLEASEPPLPDPAKQPENVPEKFILYVGSAFPHKNLERLVLAFQILKEQHADLKLVLAGKLEYHAKKLRRWVSKQPCADDVIFTGFVENAELKWLYENAGAYVFPSLSEGFGLPGLEAMAHGCPVASSDATCLPEVYGDAAHYFDPESVEDMAQKIDEVLTKPNLRESLIKKGHDQTKKYSWKRMTEQTLDIFQTILGA